MKGCDPSPVSGMKKMLSRRFRLEEVDEHLMSKTCRCQGKLERYRRRDRRLLYARLQCPFCNCGGERIKPFPRFVNRDETQQPTSCLWAPPVRGRGDSAGLSRDCLVLQNTADKEDQTGC